MEELMWVKSILAREKEKEFKFMQTVLITKDFGNKTCRTEEALKFFKTAIFTGATGKTD